MGWLEDRGFESTAHARPAKKPDLEVPMEEQHNNITYGAVTRA